MTTKKSPALGFRAMNYWYSTKMQFQLTPMIK